MPPARKTEASALIETEWPPLSLVPAWASSLTLFPLVTNPTWWNPSSAELCTSVVAPASSSARRRRGSLITRAPLAAAAGKEKTPFSLACTFSYSTVLGKSVHRYCTVL